MAIVRDKARLESIIDPHLFLRLNRMIVLTPRAVRVPHTGTTAETILTTFDVPAMDANDMLMVFDLWGYVATTTNSKTGRARWGVPGSGLAGAIVRQTAATADLTHQDMFIIANRGVTNSQISHQIGTTAFLSAAAVVSTFAIQSNVPTELTFSGQLVDASDTIRLEYCLPILIKG